MEKIRYAEGNKTLGCWELADMFDIGKHAAANILKNKKKIREHYDKFHKKNKKCNRSVKYKILNDILCD